MHLLFSPAMKAKRQLELCQMPNSVAQGLRNICPMSDRGSVRSYATNLSERKKQELPHEKSRHKLTSTSKTGALEKISD